MPGTEFQLAKLSQRHHADQTGAGGRPVELAVVHADQVPIAGEPDVAFHAVGAFAQRQIVGGQGVFRAGRRGPAVGHYERMPRDHFLGVRHVPMLPVLHPATQPLQQIPS